MQDPKNRQKVSICTTLSGYIFATKAHIDNRKKLVKQQYIPTCPQYSELRPTSGWDLLASLGHPCKFQRVSRLGSVTARHSSSRRQPNFAALNRGRHLYSAGRPSRGHHHSSNYFYIQDWYLRFVHQQQNKWHAYKVLFFESDLYIAVNTFWQ